MKLDSFILSTWSNLKNENTCNMSSPLNAAPFRLLLAWGRAARSIHDLKQNWVPHEDPVLRRARTGLSRFDTSATERHVKRSLNGTAKRPNQGSIHTKKITEQIAALWQWMDRAGCLTPYNSCAGWVGFGRKRESEDPVITPIDL